MDQFDYATKNDDEMQMLNMESKPNISAKDLDDTFNKMKDQIGEKLGF